MASYEDIVNSLITSSDGSNETSTKISQALLDQLKKKYALEEGTDSGQIKTSSTFDKIQKQVDIDGETETDSEILAKFQSLIDTSNNQAKNLWNESIKVAVNYFIKRFLDENAVIPVSSETGLGQSEQGGFLIKDIRHANAGLSFNGTAWVKPNYNIDNDIYDDVRGNDKIESVLNNQRNMQFTRTQDQSQIVSETINKYIRLLMPQYTRRVEVEDLNRNFWVIGQVLAGISAYLFDKDSPITNMFKRLISEVNQIWENILYLWAALNKPITKVHCEILYLPRTNAKQKRYDNINDSLSISDSAILTRIKFLQDQYTDCNLIVLPIIRNQNYKHNYYKNEIYKGLWFYDRNKDSWFKHDLLPISLSPQIGIFGNFEQDSNGYFKVSIEEKAYKYVTGIFSNEENYSYIYPLLDCKTEVNNYIGAIRTTPSLSGGYKDGIFEVHLSIRAQDLGNIMNFIPNSYYETYNWNSINITSSTSVLTYSYISQGTTSSNKYSGIKPLNKGFYLGELPSLPARHTNTAGLAFSYIDCRPLKEHIREFGNESGRVANLQEKANSIIKAVNDRLIDYIPTLRVGRFRNDSMAVESDGSEGYFWYQFTDQPVKKYTYTSDSFGASIFHFDNNELDTININTSELPATVFRGDYLIGAQLYLPDFEIPLNITYEQYKHWGSTTPLVWTETTSSHTIGTDTQGYDGENTDNVVTKLAQIANGNKGRQYKSYYIAEFFKKDKTQDYGIHNWAIRLTQIHVLFAPLYSTEYQKAFWGEYNPNTDLSKIKETYWIDNNSQEYQGLVSRVSIHCFSIDDNNNPLYCRREANRLVIENKKLEWDVSPHDTIVEHSSDTILNSLVHNIPNNYQRKLVKSNIPEYNTTEFNFVKYPINGYSR